MPRPRTWIGIVPIAMFGASALAQVPRVEIAFAAGASTSGLPAVSWLCSTVLPLRQEWPAGLRADESFVVRLLPGELVITQNDVALPEGSLITGSVEYERGRRALCSCAVDGVEDWYLPRDASPPLEWARLLHMLRANDVDRPHTIDAAVAAGHLLGATASGDAVGEAVQLGAALCGEVTWRAWYNGEHLRVRGRSDGGLLLPAILLVLAQQNGNGNVGELPMRAFVARDGERQEAVRQMSRPGADDRKTLLAMLHGDDELRLTAIDTLVRQGAADELPRIVEAAAPGLPLATVAAADAVAAMWDDASDTIKAETRIALAASPTEALRDLDPDRIPRGVGPAATPPVVRWRILALLFVLAICTFGFWLRERGRTAAFA